VVTDPGGGGVDPAVREGVLAAARSLEAAGYPVDEIEPPEVALAGRILVDMVSTPDLRTLWTAMEPLLPPATRRFMADFYAAAGDPDPATVMQCFITRQSLLRRWGEFQETHPLILGPVSTAVPFLVGTDLGEGPVAATIHAMRMAMAVNALGLPAVAVPVGVADGLPQSVQVIGPRYGEHVCLRAAQVIEDRLGTITPIDPR
jgi:amidase